MAALGCHFYICNILIDISPVNRADNT